MVYGNNVAGNILQSLPQGILRTIAEVLITCHVMFAFVIILNPFSQDMEELCGVPHSKYHSRKRFIEWMWQIPIKWHVLESQH